MSKHINLLRSRCMGATKKGDRCNKIATYEARKHIFIDSEPILKPVQTIVTDLHLYFCFDHKTVSMWAIKR